MYTATCTDGRTRSSSLPPRFLISKDPWERHARIGMRVEKDHGIVFVFSGVMKVQCWFGKYSLGLILFFSILRSMNLIVFQTFPITVCNYLGWDLINIHTRIMLPRRRSNWVNNCSLSAINMHDLSSATRSAVLSLFSLWCLRSFGCSIYRRRWRANLRL